MTIIPQCLDCKHLRENDTCTAFPDGIPMAILTNQHDHKKPFEGDGGIRFEPNGRRPISTAVGVKDTGDLLLP